jgi:ketosteroid isomerase-like protein
MERDAHPWLNGRGRIRLIIGLEPQQRSGGCEMGFKREIVLTALAALMAGAPLAASAQTSMDKAKAEVLAVEKKVANATTPQEGLSCFDPSIVQDDFFGPQRRGVPGVSKDFDVYMHDYATFKATIDDMKIDVQGDLAVAYSHQHFVAKGQNGAPDLNAEVRQTDVLRLRGGKWLITYQHLSVPIDLITGKAVFVPEKP